MTEEEKREKPAVFGLNEKLAGVTAEEVQEEIDRNAKLMQCGFCPALETDKLIGGKNLVECGDMVDSFGNVVHRAEFLKGRRPDPPLWWVREFGTVGEKMNLMAQQTAEEAKVLWEKKKRDVVHSELMKKSKEYERSLRDIKNFKPADYARIFAANKYLSMKRNGSKSPTDADKMNQLSRYEKMKKERDV